MKTCTKCGEIKPLHEYHGCSRVSDGKASQCKSCKKIINREIWLRKTQSKREAREERQRIKDELANEGLKTCSECNQTKPIAEFHSHQGRRDGLNNQCRECACVSKSRDHQRHRDRRLGEMKLYREANPEKVKAGKKAAYQRNRDHYIAKASLWAGINPERAKENKAKWYEDNKDRLNNKLRERYREDHEFRARQAMRSILNKFISRSSATKAGRTHDLLGYSYREFKAHIERQFFKGMTWANYGEWHVDHIVPIAEHIRNGETDPAVVNCLTNLRPMWAKENIRKSDNRTHLL